MFDIPPHQASAGPAKTALPVGHASSPALKHSAPTPAPAPTESSTRPANVAKLPEPTRQKLTASGSLLGGGAGHAALGSGKQAALGSGLHDPPGGSGGGLFDNIVSRVDRAVASIELKNKFDIVPDNFIGPKLPNQVSQAEYQKIVSTYSDIRLGKTDLKLDTAGMSDADAKKFRSDSMNDIAGIMQTGSGRSLIGQLANNTAGGERDKDGNPVHHTTTLKKAADPDSPGTSADPSVLANRGNGVGASSVVSYAPGHAVTIPGATDAIYPARSDVVLYHELTHAMYNTAGTRASGTVGVADAVDPGDVGVNQSEYQATGLGKTYGGAAISENRYRLERNMVGSTPQALPGDATLPQRTKYSPTVP